VNLDLNETLSDARAIQLGLAERVGDDYDEDIDLQEEMDLLLDDDAGPARVLLRAALGRARLAPDPAAAPQRRVVDDRGPGHRVRGVVVRVVERACVGTVMMAPRKAPEVQCPVLNTRSISAHGSFAACGHTSRRTYAASMRVAERCTCPPVESSGRPAASGVVLPSVCT
jgi:hypothetical protein